MAPSPRIALLVLAAVLAQAGAAVACDERAPCVVETGDYLVRPPAGWDGASALAVVVHFHGYRSSARDVMDDGELAREISAAGALLAAPGGLNGSWSIPGALSNGRDDLAFVRSVIADVQRRFPVDRSRLLASGFSAGGFMVWALACNAGGLFAAYASVAGAFLDPIPADCPSGPVSLRHIHGLGDTAVPMEGRKIAGGRVKQSDVEASVARLRAIDGCPEAPAVLLRDGELACRVWPAAACASGKEVQLCLHDGGHTADAGWIAGSLRWLGALPAAAKR